MLTHCSGFRYSHTHTHTHQLLTGQRAERSERTRPSQLALMRAMWGIMGFLLVGQLLLTSLSLSPCLSLSLRSGQLNRLCLRRRRDEFQARFPSFKSFYRCLQIPVRVGHAKRLVVSRFILIFKKATTTTTMGTIIIVRKQRGRSKRRGRERRKGAG